MMQELIGGAILIGMFLYGWFSVPAENPEVVAARKEYGKAE